VNNNNNNHDVQPPHQEKEETVSTTAAIPIPLPPPPMPELSAPVARSPHILRREVSEGALNVSPVSPVRAFQAREKLQRRANSEQFKTKVVGFQSELSASEGISAGNKLEQVLKQQDDERYLVDQFVASMKPIYSNGVAVSAYILFRALLQWRAFRQGTSRLLERVTDAFNKLLKIATKEEQNKEEKEKSTTTKAMELDEVLYWLSTTTTLLHLLRRELQVISSGSLDGVVKPFDSQLFWFASSFYSLFCRRIQEQLNGVLTDLLSTVAIPGNEACSINTNKLISLLSDHYSLLQDHIPFQELRDQIIQQEFYYISGKFMNSFLTEGNDSLSRCGSGLTIKMVVLQIEDWAFSKGTKFGNVCREKLAIVRQAADVLVVNKMSLLQQSVRSEVCPSLSCSQLIRLLEVYNPDDFDPEPVHPGVISGIRSTDLQQQNQANNNANNNNNAQQSLVVDINYIASLEPHFTKEVFDMRNIIVPSSILERPGFIFLRNDSSVDNRPW